MRTSGLFAAALKEQIIRDNPTEEETEEQTTRAQQNKLLLQWRTFLYKVSGFEQRRLSLKASSLVQSECRSCAESLVARLGGDVEGDQAVEHTPNSQTHGGPVQQLVHHAPLQVDRDAIQPLACTDTKIVTSSCTHPAYR